MKSSPNASLASLPAELALLIFSRLPLSTLAALRRVDHYFSTLIGENESTVYRNAAWIEGWVPSSQTQLEELRITKSQGDEDKDEQRSTRQALYSQRAMRGVRGWKDFCRKRKTVSLSWSAQAPSTILSPPLSKSAPLPLNVRNRSPHSRVHRIKVDEKAGLVMTTSAVGGLVVRDLESDTVLWELPVSYVPAYAHLEYDRGYMIFNRDDGNTEVWQRTEDSSSPSSLIASYPDERQLKMAERLSAAVQTACARAQFTPYALFIMPEHTRASRFVFPTLLASSLERAFLWDVPTGERVQTIEGIQVVLPLTDFEAPGGDEVEDPAEDEDDGMDVDDGSDSGDAGDDDEAAAMLLVHANPMDISNGQLADEVAMTGGHPFQHLHSIPELSPIGSPASASDDDHHPFTDGGEGLEDDEDEEDMLPRFLGLIRYVEVSERHVVIVGRYLLRIFSRATGKAILDIPSTRPRYGSVLWEVASAAWARGVGTDDTRNAEGKGKGKNRADSYPEARKEGRELVRMPLKFTYEDWSRSSRLVIDQFMAAHLSSDGQHLVALLSGLRVLIIPYFETLSTSPPSSPLASAFTSASTSNALPPSAEASSSATMQAANGQQRTMESLYTLRAARRRLQREREREVYLRTLDVQLGAPRAAGSVYLAYENGRIGVVTTNAVYIVTPNIPSSRTDAIPNLTVSRVPFFSNPSWLSAVSCLMMSDTGMYLNWNPTSESPQDIVRSLAYAGTAMAHDDVGDHGRDGSAGDRDGRGEDRKDISGTWVMWEQDYQWDLDAYEIDGAERYHTLPNGDMFVAREPRGAVAQSHVSIVCTINFAPDDSVESQGTSPHVEAHSSSKES